MTKEKINPIIEKEVIKIFRYVEGDRGTELSVCRFIVDGQAHSPQLINQEVYTDRIDRKRRHGKLKGFKWGDVKFLSEHLDEILELLIDIPGRKQRPSPQESAANDVGGGRDGV